VIVVIGVGNAFRGDDAAGLHVARAVAAAAPPGVEVREHEGEPAGLIEAWDGSETAYVVDAVRSGAPPGTVHRIEVVDEPLPARRPRDSSHALSLGEAVALGRALDRMPRRLALVGIEGSDFEAGEGLSPAVAAAVAEVADGLLGEVGAGP
jgi:hydrogenase maturation protease